MGKIVNVVGATGLIGRELVGQLLESREIDTVRIFVRRDAGFRHPRLEQHIIDFEKTESWAPLVQGDVLFSALGTTLKQAGSKENQYLVDFTWQYRFAESASRNGIPDYVLVSAAGAHPKSMIFYSWMKGKLDEKVRELPFRNIIIFRPSILAGKREKRRPAEEWSVRCMDGITKFALKRYRPVPAATVARAMIRASFSGKASKYSIVNLNDIFTLAGS